MIKTSLLVLLAYFYQGCASTIETPSHFSKSKVSKRMHKYADNQGCKMLKNGYMVCPKSHNR